MKLSREEIEADIALISKKKSGKDKAYTEHILAMLRMALAAHDMAEALEIIEEGGCDFLDVTKALAAWREV